MVITDVLTWISNHWIWSIILGSLLVGLIGGVAANLGILAGYLLVFLLAAAVAWGAHQWLYLWAFLLGVMTAFTEIIGKFRDEPLKSFRTREALFYHAFNGVVSMFALYVLMFYWTDTPSRLDQMKAVLVAGLGSMLIMRSRLFDIKLGQEDISFGPEQFVKVFLRFMEKAIDRVRAQARMDFVKKTMQDIDASKVKEYTLTMLEATQALESKEEVKKKIRDICDSQGVAQLKSYLLAFVLVDNMGEDFVTQLFAERRPEWLFRAPVSRESEGFVSKLGLGGQKAQMVSYFAYGRTMSTSQMLQRLGWTSDQADKVWQNNMPRRALLDKHRLIFGIPSVASKNHGVLATITPAEDKKVEGVLYFLPENALSFLFTSYEPGFKRREVTVKVDQDEKPYQSSNKAYTWIAEIEEREPSKEYLNLMLAGAREHGLSKEYVDKLEKKLVQNVAPEQEAETEVESGGTPEDVAPEREAETKVESGGTTASKP